MDKYNVDQKRRVELIRLTQVLAKVAEVKWKSKEERLWRLYWERKNRQQFESHWPTV